MKKQHKYKHNKHLTATVSTNDIGTNTISRQSTPNNLGCVTDKYIPYVSRGIAAWATREANDQRARELNGDNRH